MSHSFFLLGDTSRGYLWLLPSKLQLVLQVAVWIILDWKFAVLLDYSSVSKGYVSIVNWAQALIEDVHG